MRWYPQIPPPWRAYHKYPRLIINPQDLSTSPKLYTSHIYGGSTQGRACAPASWAIWPLWDSEHNIREMLSLPLCSGGDPAAFSRDSVNLKWSGQCKGPKWRVIDRCEFPIPAFYKVAEKTKKKYWSVGIYESVFKKNKESIHGFSSSETEGYVQCLLVMLRYCCMIHRLGEDASLHS